MILSQIRRLGPLRLQPRHQRTKSMRATHLPSMVSTLRPLLPETQGPSLCPPPLLASHRRRKRHQRSKERCIVSFRKREIEVDRRRAQSLSHNVLYSSKKEEKKAKAAAAKAAAAAEAVADVDMSEVAARNNSGKKKPSADAPRQPKPKKSRVGYAEGEEYDRLSKAIYDWDNDTGDKLDPNGEPLSMRAFCIEVGIPKKTFEKYVCADVSKRRKLGRRAGRPALLSKESKDIIEDSLARADRANDGYSRKEAIDTVVNSLVSLPRHLHVLVLLYLASTCS